MWILGLIAIFVLFAILDSVVCREWYSPIQRIFFERGFYIDITKPMHKQPWIIYGRIVSPTELKDLYITIDPAISRKHRPSFRCGKIEGITI